MTQALSPDGRSSVIERMAPHASSSCKIRQHSMLRALVLLIYNLLLPVGLLLMAPGAWKKMRLRGGSPSDLWQRFGFFSADQLAHLRALQSPEGVFWIHAVSVGEVGIAAK